MAHPHADLQGKPLVPSGPKAQRHYDTIQPDAEVMHMCSCSLNTATLLLAAALQH